MTDFQTFAAVFALQNFSTKFKILKKNHFKQKCNGFVTVEIHTFHSWKSCVMCCRQVHQQHQIRIGSGMIVDVRPNLDCHSSPQICGNLIFTRWFIAVADFWLVIFYSSILNVVLTRDCHCRKFGWTLREFFFLPHQKIFEYIHDIPLIYLLKHQIINVKENFLCDVYVVQYISDIFCL